MPTITLNGIGAVGDGSVVFLCLNDTKYQF